MRQRYRQRAILKATQSLLWREYPDLDTRAFTSTARRFAACEASFHVRVENRPHEATRIIVKHKRACRSRCCEICKAVIAYKTFKRFRAAINHIPHLYGQDVRAIMLTLTLPTQDALTAETGVNQKALKRFWKGPARDVTLGHVTSVEVKPSGTAEKPTLHIHSHSLAYVPGSFFIGGPLIHQRQWALWWADAAQLSIKPVVDVRACTLNGETDHYATAHSCREILKYAINGDGVVHRNDDGTYWADPTMLFAVWRAQHRRHLVSYDRCFRHALAHVKAHAASPNDDTYSEAYEAFEFEGDEPSFASGAPEFSSNWKEETD